MLQCGARMDVLSEVLKAVKLDGAMFHNAEFSAPWCVRSPASCSMASFLWPTSKHVIIYHLLTAGRGYAHVEGDDRSVPLNAGDIVVFPHGDPHILGSGSPVKPKPLDYQQVLQRMLAQGLKVSRLAEVERSPNSSAATRPASRNSARSSGGLPPIFKVSNCDDASGQWLETLSAIRWVVQTHPGLVMRLCSLGCPKCCSAKRCDATSHCSRGNKPGGWPASATRMSESVGLATSSTGSSLTIASLRQRRTSRLYWPNVSALSSKPPLPTSHVGDFIGAQLLKSTSSGVAQVAAEVGYAEPSFNCAFKREFCLPPAHSAIEISPRQCPLHA